MEASPLKQAMTVLMFLFLLWVVACSTGAPPKSQPTVLTPAQQEEQDPEFWRIWQERRGLGE